LIIDFSNFCVNTCSGLDVNKNVNSWINLIFVGVFHLRVQFLTIAPFT